MNIWDDTCGYCGKETARLGGFCSRACEKSAVPAPQLPADATITSHPWLQYPDPDARGCLHQERPSGEFCGRPRSAHAQPAGPPVESRSAQKRKAIMRGEEMPTFAAAPPVTGDGDAAVVTDVPHLHMVTDVDGLCMNCGLILGVGDECEWCRAFCIGLARGRALGVMDENAACEKLARDSQAETDENCRQHSTPFRGIAAERIAEAIARRAGREGK